MERQEITRSYLFFISPVFDFVLFSLPQFSYPRSNLTPEPAVYSSLCDPTPSFLPVMLPTLNSPGLVVGSRNTCSSSNRICSAILYVSARTVSSTWNSHLPSLCPSHRVKIKKMLVLELDGLYSNPWAATAELCKLRHVHLCESHFPHLKLE